MIDGTILYIKKLENLLGLELYLVGGAVRDLLLGKQTKDFDFTTPANPDQIEQAIQNAGFKTYLLGKKFGTIGFRLDGDLIEITTFRNETYTSGSRKPSVEFHQDIRLDLERRDFSINAMAISSKGDLIDFFDGQTDLKNKTIRAVGNPTKRFEEDALRMLRAIRFAGQYNFEIETQTYKAIQNNFWQLSSISKERWVLELDQILSQSSPDYALDILLESGVLNIILPEINLLGLHIWNQFTDISFWAKLKLAINKISFGDSDYLDRRWSVFLSQIYKPLILSGLLHKHPLEIDKNVITMILKEYENSDWFKFMQSELAYKSGIYLKFSKKRLEAMKNIILNGAQ